MEENKPKVEVLKRQTNWRELWFYKKAVVLYQLTYVFTRRFLPAYGDRTVDQMVQAARSGKQNIVEGTADGVTSTEMELKLLNVARASIQELVEDYEDYIIGHQLIKWEQGQNDMIQCWLIVENIMSWWIMRSFLRNGPTRRWRM